jgi:hypothetical protein
MDGAVQVYAGDGVPKEAGGNLKMTPDEAIAKADGIFEAAGVGDIVGLFEMYLVDNHGTGHVDNNYDAASTWAYKLYYGRNLNGAPIACHNSETASGDGYNIGWYHESITVIIGDSGFYAISWQSPCEVTEVLTENADIIPFDQAVSAFEQNVKNMYLARANMSMAGSDETKTEIDVNVDEIRLSLVRTREKDRPGERTGLYVPAYVFYGEAIMHTVSGDGYEYTGYITSEAGGSDFDPGPLAVVAVNAIDGSAIDLLQ